ncbi:unnamed protein product [Orchesella dallaii]|uniref:C2H2-type domain-containing protein n=1 Tax=Orchesella dallaii TaxID=48710 RepID=A0ABP1RVR7_9HEXA
MTRIHRLVKCVECSLITTLGNFIPTHLKKKLTCGNTTPIPWITNEKDADWYVSRKYIDGKTVFWIERPCIANQRPSQGENFQCKYKGCQRYYATKLTLDKHIRNTHRNFRCGVCAGIFSSRQFNSHLKKSPECAQMDPQPCDIENHKEADWTIIREVKYGKTTFRFIPATNTNREFQCNYPECSLSFSDKKSAQSHMTRIHRLVKCVECSLITTLRNFIPTHLKKKLTCGNTTPIPWFKKNVNDSDWYVSRKYIDEKTVFSIQSLANRRPNQERNFQCKYKGCQRCYATKKKLDEHLGYAHKHFKCSVCARIYNRFRFNRHLKKSPECAQMDPQPWDIENQKEAEWTFIRKGKDGKTTLHLITRKRKSQCNFEGCTMSFPGRAQYLLHIQHHQKHFRCSRCSEIHSIEKFNTEHLKKNPKCGKKKPQPWDKKNEKEADWLVIRMRFNGKTRFSYRRLANPGKGPESDTDSDENITFGTESNVYINHSRKPQRTTWLSKYVERNALTNMTCEVFGCSYHTTHAVLLRHHYKTNHSSLMRNWSVSFDAASQDMHCCSTRKCRFQTNSDQLFESHNKRHIKLFAFQCFLCHQLYQYKNSLTEHLMETHKIFRNPNKFVVYIYDQKSKPKRRMEGTNLYCSICNRQIQTARFKNHLRRMHPPKIPLQHCNFCNPNQNSIGSDELRDKTMDLKCSFKTCGFETLTFQDFRQHSLSHQYFKSQILAHETDIRSTANVSFECPRNNCKFHTSSQYVLNRHENNHRHGLSARCLLCYDIFRTTDKFLNHVATRHKIHVNRLALYDDCNEDNGIVKLYQCNLEHCTGFVTLIKSIYEEHLFHHVSHTSDTFRCGLCSLPLTTARELISHFERSHSSADLTLKNNPNSPEFVEYVKKELNRAWLLSISKFRRLIVSIPKLLVGRNPDEKLKNPNNVETVVFYTLTYKRSIIEKQLRRDETLKRDFDLYYKDILPQMGVYNQDKWLAASSVNTSRVKIISKHVEPESFKRYERM